MMVGTLLHLYSFCFAMKEFSGVLSCDVAVSSE